MLSRFLVTVCKMCRSNKENVNCLVFLTLFLAACYLSLCLSLWSAQWGLRSPQALLGGLSEHDCSRLWSTGRTTPALLPLLHPFGTSLQPDHTGRHFTGHLAKICSLTLPLNFYNLLPDNSALLCSLCEGLNRNQRMVL